MELIIDANILFSALIKNSLTINFLFKKDLILFSPDFMIDEFTKYKKFLAGKSSRNEEEFIQIQHMLKDVITIIPKEEYSNFIETAKKISPDIDDVMYFASALKLNCGIWSNDKKLKEQDKIKIYSTKDLLQIIKS